MSATGLKAFDSTLQTTHIWLDEVMREMHVEEKQRAYHALRAVLHTLRDRLPLAEAVHLGAQLPMLVRGIYYEGWHPADKPIKRNRDQFLEHVSGEIQRDPDADPVRATRAVFHVLSNHVTGEIEHVKASLPPDVRELWT